MADEIAIYFRLKTIVLYVLYKEWSPTRGSISVFTLVENLEIERYKIDAMQLFSYATETGLTAYDASYLLLAKKYNCEIATFDKQLLAVAEKEGMKVAIC